MLQTIVHRSTRDLASWSERTLDFGVPDRATRPGMFVGIVSRAFVNEGGDLGDWVSAELPISPNDIGTTDVVVASEPFDGFAK